MNLADVLRRVDRLVLPELSRIASRLGRGPARLRVLTGSAAVSALTVVFAAVWVTAHAPSAQQVVADPLRVGVAQGQSIPVYVQSARAELAALAASRAPNGTLPKTFALVSLNRYLPPDRLASVLADTPVAAVYGRVPLAGVRTEVVRITAQRLPDDLVAGMAAVAARKEWEASELRARATTAELRQADIRQEYERGARVADAEARALRAGCSCAYAAIVWATAPMLQRVARGADVRAVDPAPEVSRLEQAEFLPPLPEQAAVGDPPAEVSSQPAPAGGVTKKAADPTDAPTAETEPSDPLISVTPAAEQSLAPTEPPVATSAPATTGPTLPPTEPPVSGTPESGSP